MVCDRISLNRRKHEYEHLKRIQGVYFTSAENRSPYKPCYEANTSYYRFLFCIRVIFVLYVAYSSFFSPSPFPSFARYKETRRSVAEMDSSDRCTRTRVLGRKVSSDVTHVPV